MLSLRQLGEKPVSPSAEFRAAGVYATLVRHFFSRFFDSESLSPQGEPEANVIQTLGILAVPGAFFVLLFRPLTLAARAFFPGKVNLVGLSVVYVLGFTTYSRTMAEVESWLSQAPAAALLFFATAAASWLLLAWRRKQPHPHKTVLDFEDPGDPVVRTLGLTPQ